VIHRVCEEPGCVTILSSYNPGPFCWTHTHFVIKPQRVQDKHHLVSQTFIDGVPGTYRRG
jgi:hypothetical protein